MMFTSAPMSKDQQRLDMSNKGHQLLQKMGWSGSTGLGRKEQGIYNPIEGGQVREKSEMYRGVGTRSDPFEAFRKNKSQGYIQRLRDRDEQRESKLKFWALEINGVFYLILFNCIFKVARKSTGGAKEDN